MFKDLIFLLIICVGAFFVLRWLAKYKSPKIGSLTMVTGGVKTGKSTLSVHLAISTHKKSVFKVKVYNFFAKLFKKPLKDLPLLYSNVPLAYDYVLLDTDLLLRKKRFVYGSVIYIQEASLVADSQLIRDMDINNRLLMFNKLIGHETKGGYLIYDTQQIQDVHYSIKRSMSNYIYVHHLKKVPFFIIMYVRELMYSEDGSVMNNITKDLEEDLKKVIIPKSVWKKFDCYCLSSFTDDLPVEKQVIKFNKSKDIDLKARKIISFRSDYNLYLSPKNKDIGVKND